MQSALLIKLMQQNHAYSKVNANENILDTII